jgi:hypothetical protein
LKERKYLKRKKPVIERKNRRRLSVDLEARDKVVRRLPWFI